MVWTYIENEGEQSNEKQKKKNSFRYQKLRETAAYVGRECGDGPKQAECGKLDTACSWQEEMGKSSWSDLVHEVDVESTKKKKQNLFQLNQKLNPKSFHISTKTPQNA